MAQRKSHKKHVYTQIARLTCNHGRFRAHLNKIKLSEDDRCTYCKKERGDTNHIIFGCEVHKDKIDILLKDLQIMQLALPVNVNYVLAQDQKDINCRLYKHLASISPGSEGHLQL
ncbi:hypothetical protein QE152_g22440 [Popillia japonica]|uniref:Reverse transcriptase zinc-binding domain-containing protein n=1 Tax=Popillia japonica TaxID=7064 RepID=A0AAW1KKR7_POPJA